MNFRNRVVRTRQKDVQQRHFGLREGSFSAKIVCVGKRAISALSAYGGNAHHTSYNSEAPGIRSSVRSKTNGQNIRACRGNAADESIAEGSKQCPFEYDGKPDLSKRRDQRSGGRVSASVSGGVGYVKYTEDQI